MKILINGVLFACKIVIDNIFVASFTKVREDDTKNQNEINGETSEAAQRLSDINTQTDDESFESEEYDESEGFDESEEEDPFEDVTDSDIESYNDSGLDRLFDAIEKDSDNADNENDTE